ncbi:LOW QUALITY PROTEIN: DNA-directed RNA polymerases II and V subunit 8A [Jatropha curcas]|uniref:LOW QUALITY PROTEIN: DNA-directed RNA polymerases II and V subunit 8A n=1 Tax=Jatropha curcas TaxID=180498 RepID=UPI00189464A0|nr:LOW QUALITY PROTEIN: DNA-directed RNA polymerases II and V subunit 8A [Jatropha curcas]
MEDIIIVDSMDKKFDKVSRIEAHSERLEMQITLDVNTEIYPIIKIKDKFALLITPTLHADGTGDTGYYIQGKEGSIADKYEYIMYGKLYKITEEGSNRRRVQEELFISFGGLLLDMKGNPDYVTEFQLDHKYYLCMRKLD